MLHCIIFYQSNRVLKDESSLYNYLLLLQVIVGVISYYHVTSSPSLQFLLTGSWSRDKWQKNHQVRSGRLLRTGKCCQWLEIHKAKLCVSHHTLPKSRIADMSTPAKETTLVKLLVVDTAPVASKNTRLLTTTANHTPVSQHPGGTGNSKSSKVGRHTTVQEESLDSQPPRTRKSLLTDLHQ